MSTLKTASLWPVPRWAIFSRTWFFEFARNIQFVLSANHICKVWPKLFKSAVCNPCQSSPSWTILVSLWFTIIHLVCFYLSYLSFSGFLQFKVVRGLTQNAVTYTGRVNPHTCNSTTLIQTILCLLTFSRVQRLTKLPLELITASEYLQVSGISLNNQRFTWVVNVFVMS